VKQHAARRAALVLLLAVAGGCQQLVDRMAERNLVRVDESVLRSPDLQVVLCGTGSPLADPDRAAACTAVIAGGHFFLVDAGDGSANVVDLANLPLARLRGVLLTHFHSDHIADLGEVNVRSWIAGRTEPLAVHGPPGVARIVAGLNEAYAFDVDARVAHHGDAYMPRAAAAAVARETALPAARDAASVVFEADGLRITMFRVDHAPVDPAVGYRFDFAGRSVVVSGDTRRSESLIRHAKGADLLVHEALASQLTERAVAAAQRLGMERTAKLAADIPGYHTSPREAGEVAEAAGVAHLVLSHLVPAPRNFLMERAFTGEAQAVFSGKVTIGEDGMRFALPPR
jgi:ribonuclease Z